jgi:membrane-bound inhibitor of C-type lysozyme
MTKLMHWTTLAAIMASTSAIVAASELTITLTGSDPISRRTVMYQCDSTGVSFGVPEKPFEVEYINGGGNSLAVVPIKGQSLIFANVVSANGARYAARTYIWWDARGEVQFWNGAGSHDRSVCKQVK